jgi:hypothetical protein
MTSAIDATKPAEGQAYTIDVRENFSIARDEISALQDLVAAMQEQIDSIAVVAQTGTWAWVAAPLTGTLAPPVKPSAGVDTDDPTLATVLSLTPASLDGTDFSALLQALVAGDGLLLQERTNAANRMRFRITAPGTVAGDWITLPITLDLVAGVEPADGSDVALLFMLSPSGGP